MKTIYSICVRTGFFFTFLLLATSLMAQNIQVKGLVKDPAGEAIIGASVVVKGTTNGSITDLDGKFSLSDVPSGATITVSYIGYLSQEKKVSATPMEFILKEDTKTLDEIVVVGYGTTKKSSISGAVASVKADELPTAASASVGSMLRGRSSGMNITQNSANPGGSMNISIRGGLSGQSPLIVIDGVPQLSTKTVTTGTAYSGGEKDNALINLNPNDIETIDILKDASAAAIYGSDASGGVILITTKRGKTGKPDISYSGSVAFQYIKDAPDFLNARDFMIEQNKVFDELGRGDEKKEKYIPYVIEPSLGADRVVLAFLCAAYDEEELEGGDVRTVLHFHPALAPVKIGVLPLSKKLNEGAEKIYAELSKKYNCEFDDRGNIGKRYRRQDEIGTPFCVTYDFDSETDGCVTVRFRDSMEQERVAIKDLDAYFADKFTF